MSKSSNQKLKLLYLIKILQEMTDENNGITTRQIQSFLQAEQINADRKTIYADLEELRSFGYDIIAEKRGHDVYYHLVSREFELAELKLLVDSIQAAKFVTDKKSRELIKKIENLASRADAKKLHRQVVLSGRVKTINESIYYNVDRIHSAIAADSRISFHYFQWNARKEMVFRRNGEAYVISPWTLIWDDEYYYMIGYDSEAGKMKHYRVDKMLDIIITDEPRDGGEVFRDINLPRYAKSLFNMYGGEEIKITLECHNSLAGVIIDRFGKDIIMQTVDDEHFRTLVDVSLSDMFLGWIISLGDQIKVVAPDLVIEKIRDLLERVSRQYE